MYLYKYKVSWLGWVVLKGRGRRGIGCQWYAVVGAEARVKRLLHLLLVLELLLQIENGRNGVVGWLGGACGRQAKNA